MFKVYEWLNRLRSGPETVKDGKMSSQTGLTGVNILNESDFIKQNPK